MKIWILSDLHADRGIEDIGVNAPDFDIFVCAGDVLSGDIQGSIEMTAAIARGKPSILVAGNHEWMTAGIDDTLELGHAAAARTGVRFLECDIAETGGVRFAGATLWYEGDSRYFETVKFLQQASADVIVTHFEPPAALLMKANAKLWVYGHHHGHFDRSIAGRRLVRNALARQDFVLEFEP